MIVLDSADKTLEIVAAVTTIDVVVAYWSVDVAGKWTPASAEVDSINGTVTILDGPILGAETARVVENIWIYNGDVATQDVLLQMDNDGTDYIIKSFDAIGIKATAVLKRDGSTAEEAE
jgi:hypothetical protein